MNLNYEVFQWINSFAGKSSAMDSVMVIITNSVPYFIMACLLLLWFSGKTEEQFITVIRLYTCCLQLYFLYVSMKSFTWCITTRVRL